MLLKNKKTGEIKPAEAREDGIYLYDKITEQWYKYELDLLAKWWEYYEEPKRMWAVGEFGELYEVSGLALNKIDELKEIGNYFETEKEAELAVRKLKAWKRLKNTITCIDRASFDDVGTATLFIRYEEEYHKKVKKDLDLLCGGEK